MRLRITFEIEKFNGTNSIPLNYQYMLASALYKTMEKGDSIYSSWLHDTGIRDGHKAFKFFTFSRLKPERYRIEHDRLVFLTPLAEYYVSFYTNSHAEPFIKGLFRDTCLELGDRSSRIRFRAVKIEKPDELNFREEMTFRCLSPVVVSYKQPGQRYPEYLTPDSSRYKELIFRNLRQKYFAYHGKPDNAAISGMSDNYDFKIRGEIKKKGVTIREGKPDESRIIGYETIFTIKLPGELMRIGYYAGFGEKNSMGFGCVDIVSK